jgi:hypothetical protein
MLTLAPRFPKWYLSFHRAVADGVSLNPVSAKLMAAREM